MEKFTAFIFFILITLFELGLFLLLNKINERKDETIKEKIKTFVFNIINVVFMFLGIYSYEMFYASYIAGLDTFTLRALCYESLLILGFMAFLYYQLDFIKKKRYKICAYIAEIIAFILFIGNIIAKCFL